MSDRKIPIVETYRGVGIHDCQPQARIEGTVKPAIDAVIALNDLNALFDYAGDVSKPPEARLLAEAKCEAIFQSAVDERRKRPDMDLSRLRARTAGLDVNKWRDARHYCSVLDPIQPTCMGGKQPEKRETALTDEDGDE